MNALGSNAGSSFSRRTLALLSTMALALAAGCGGVESGAEAAATATTTAQALSTVAARSLQLSSPAAIAGGTLTGTVTLTGSAQSASGGVVVYLGFQSAQLAGPRFVRIPNGRSSATFTLSVSPFLAAPANAVVSASTQSPQAFSYLTQTLALAPSTSAPATRPQVASVTLAPAHVTSGTATAGTVTLTAPAPAGGAAVQLSNSGDFFNQDADLPPVVVVAAGQTAATFTVQTHLSSATATTLDEIIVANLFGGGFQGAYLTIDAAPR
jgi:hypothetical protein